MQDLCRAFAMLKSYGAVTAYMHGTYVYVTFKSMGDSSAFMAHTPGASLDAELTVKVDLNAYLRACK